MIAEFEIQTNTCRRIEKDWSKKLCRVLDNLGRETTTGNPLVLDKLSELALRVGSMKYTLGSEMLKNQVDEWNGCVEHNVRTNDLENAINPKEYNDILKQRQKRPTVVNSSDINEFSEFNVTPRKPLKRILAGSSGSNEESLSKRSLKNAKT